MKTGLLAILCIGVAASGASATDWRVKTELGQSLEINDNRDLQKKPAGVTYTSVSNLILDILARTPTEKLEAGTNLTYRTYFGPGALDTPDALDKDARIKFTKTRPLTTYDIGANWSQRDAGNVQIEENGVQGTASGDIITYSVEGSVQHQFSARDKFVFSARGSSVSFTTPSPSQRPYDDLSANATWTYRATRTTDLIALVNHYFKQDATSTTEISKATAGIHTRPSDRMTFTGSAGAVYLKGTGSNVLTISPQSTLPSGGSAVSWVAEANLTYRLTRTLRLSLFAGRNVSADSFGDVQLREWIGLYATEEINRRSSLTVSSNLSRSAGGGVVGGTAETFDVAAAYNYRLTPELYSSLTYRFTQRFDQTGSAKSNSVLMAVRREFTLLP